MKIQNQSAVLIVGNFLSAKKGSRDVCEELAIRLPESGWPVITTSSRLSRFLRLVDMLWTAWRSRDQYNVALVDVFSGPAFFWAEAVCWLLGRLSKPHILTLHGGNLPSFARRWPGRVRRLLTSASAVTTPSRYLLEEMAIYRSDLVLLPNPVDISIYSYHLRANPKPTVIWLRAFHTIYNPLLAAKAIARLRGDFPEIQLTMVGPDKGDGSFEAFKAAVHELDIKEQVHCPGGVPKHTVSEWLNRSDIFLNTTNVDNTPVSVIEAMACGLCVVSTNAGGVPYLLEDECDALLVPPNDPQAMADAIRRILTEPGLAERLSRNARAKAEQFDWSIVLPQWEALLTSVIEQH